MDITNVLLILTVIIFSTLYLKIWFDGTLLYCQQCANRKLIFCNWFNINYHKVIAYLSNAEVIILIDFDNETYITVAYYDQEDDNSMYGYIYTSSKTGNLRFFQDGTVTRANQMPSYIKNWLPLDQKKRIWMVLRGARNFEF